VILSKANANEKARQMKILILGGTGEARELAERLVALGHEAITSLAGRTSHPMLPEGELRVGKFGGVPGLCAYIAAQRIELLVDATHPYAGLISLNAVAAAEMSGVPLLRLMRAPWAEPEGANWLHAEDVAAAARILPTGSKALLTTGHRGLEEFLKRDDCEFVVRLIDAPDLTLPRHARLLRDRPPYGLDGEMDLMRREAVTHLVSKNSGGTQTATKLEAARLLGVTVMMIARPVYGPETEVTRVEDALNWVRG
jgi:precorrin-6A/cobalt-precorrin-6A reductase